MSRYRKRFILKMLSFISLVLIALGVLLGLSFKEFYVNNEKEKLADETALVETMLRDRSVSEMAQYVDRLYAESNFHHRFRECYSQGASHSCSRS